VYGEEQIAVGDTSVVTPNSALQRAGTHKVLGRGRPSHCGSRERWRARVLIDWRAAAELGS
jgi:hypothetical protein